jgi:gluconolactonase
MKAVSCLDSIQSLRSGERLEKRRLSMKALTGFICVLSIGSMFAQAPPSPPATETVAPGIPGVVAAGTKVIVVKDGFQSTEGPIAMPDGSVLFSEPGASLVHKIDKDGKITQFADNTDHSNGLAFDSKGRLIATQSLSVGVIYPKGSEKILAKYPSRPNDLVIDKKDGIYYTLPGATPPVVYYLPSGGQPFVAGEVDSPHGVQLSPDEKTLYVGNSYGLYLVAFDVQPDGRLTNRRNLGEYKDVKKTERGADSNADGIAVDAEGRIYVGTVPGVQVFSKTGQHLGLIPTSQRPQNLAFGGPDKKTLYLAGRSALFRVQMIAQGYKGRPK